jgi:hypothetical protein
MRTWETSVIIADILAEIRTELFPLNATDSGINIVAYRRIAMQKASKKTAVSEQKAL